MKNYTETSQFAFYGMIAVILIVLLIAFTKVVLIIIGSLTLIAGVLISIAWWNNTKLERKNRHYEKKNKRTYDHYRRANGRF